MSVELIFFFLLALGVVVTSLLVVTFRNPINSAVSLIGTFLFMAGIYALISAPFMAVIQVMVYAGAIMVLFLFVIMLLNLQDDELGASKFTITKVIAAVVAAGLFFALVQAIDTIRVAPDVAVSAQDAGKTPAAVLAAEGEQFDAAGVKRFVLVDGRAVRDPAAVLEEGQVVSVTKSRFPGLARMAPTPSQSDARFAMGLDEEGQPMAAEQLQATSADRAQVRRQVALWDEYGSIESVGKRVYTKWVFAFEITALLLLAAIVGAVVMAKRRL